MRTCADRSRCASTTVGKSKYCRTHRAESRARFKNELMPKWKAEAEARKAVKQAERIAELQAELAELSA